MDHDEALIARLPLPLAQLARRACNGKSVQERHHAAYYLWEAGLKLLGATAVVAYVETGRTPDARLSDCLHNLARPAVGQWWAIVRALTVELADNDPAFARIRDLLLGRQRDDLPRVAGLDAALLSVLEGRSGSRSAVRLTELFDRLVRYRNTDFGHGAVGMRREDHYETMGRALLAGVPQLLERLDVLAGRTLLYLADVRRLSSGGWLVERYQLTGEAPRRLESSEQPHAAAAKLLPQQVYLAGAALLPLHPLVGYEFEANEFRFLNARRGKQRVESLCYTTGAVSDRVEPAAQNALLARLLGVAVDDAQRSEWEVRSQAAEDPFAATQGEESPAVRRLGEFELLSELGRGGMGVVYRAWQPSLGRQVALKSLLKVGDARAEKRFAREIAALGQVEHPHLVRIFTSGAEGDRWFYVMELVEGTTLAAVCKRLQASGSSAGTIDLPTWQQAVSTACEDARAAEKPLSGDQAGPAASWQSGGRRAAGAPVPPADHTYVRHVAELLQQAASAAHALHERGIIHRDIKPGNIIVGPDGILTTLMDLGLAQLAHEVEGQLTKTREFVGTLRYASPEQVLAVARLDRRTDVYSLGATLWELLTLRPIFGATEAMPTPDLMLLIQSADPESPRRYNRHVPRDLEAIVLKCLEKDRGRRYAAAAELVDDLGRWLRGEPVLAHRQTSVYRLGKRVRRHRKKVGAAAVMVLSLPVVWLGLADGGLSVPGSQAVQHWLDRHEASLFRPAPSAAQLRSAAAVHRRALRDHLLDMVTRHDGWAVSDVVRDTNSWTQMQVATALFSAPPDDGGYPPPCMKAITHTFEAGAAGGEFIPGFGWSHWRDHEPSAEAVAWANFAIARALACHGAVSAEGRAELLRRLDDVQAALENFQSRDPQSDQPNGGWNLFRFQQDPGKANLYIGLIVSQGLLELRRADLPWRGSRERRDALLAQSIDWMVRQFREPGWSTPGTVRESFNDGITLQIFTVLLQAEAAGVLELPAAVLKQIPRQLAVCGAHPLEHRTPAAVFEVEIRDYQHGKVRWAERLCRALWHAWAIHCASCWVRRCERVGTPHDEIVRTRRVLAHLILELGAPAVEEAKQAFTYVPAEMMMCLASLDAP